MNRIKLFLLILVLLSASCRRILFSNDEESREIRTGPFRAVRIEGIYDVVLVQDSADKVIVTGTNNINTMEAEVINDTLIISKCNSVFNTAINTLTLHFSDLAYMVTYDPVNVSNIDTIRVNQFYYDAIGEISEVNLQINCNSLIIYNSANTLGYLYFSGKADDCVFFNRYGSSIFSGALTCRFAEIINESAGDVYVNASEKIRASIRSSGNIYFYGTPVIEIADQGGKGKIIHVPE